MGPSNKTVVSIKFLARNKTESENATKHVSEEIQSCLPWTVDGDLPAGLWNVPLKQNELQSMLTPIYNCY